MHQGELDKGWATTAADQRRDVEMVAAMGARFLRLAHYQHSQETYRACDELGLLVWSEIPLVHSSSPTKEFNENCQQQFREMIRHNRSHASVICWGLFNHVAAMDYQIAQLQDLTRIAREIDPTRFTAGAASHAEESAATRITDAIGFNVFFGWYLPDYRMYAVWADDFHAKNPRRLFGLSEYGSGASINDHAEKPLPPSIAVIKKLPHSEEYHALHHEEVWLQLRQRPFLWCKLIWAMFDYAADDRTDAELPGRGDMGLVTIDRKVKKDAYFWYQANWTSEPMVHITSRRFTQRASVVEVKAYTNCETAILRVNGKAFEPLEPTDRRLIWKGVALQPGDNVVTVTAVRDGKALTDQVIWKAP
jgi:beta-galactosidase